MRPSPLAAALLALSSPLWPLGGCGPKSPSGEARGELQNVVAVTSPPAAYIAEVVLGPGVLDLVGPADPPGAWSPTDEELGRLVSARRVLLMGHEFEPWAQRAGLPPSRTLVLGDHLLDEAVLTTAKVTHTHGNGPSHSHGGAVPTTWTSPALLRTLVHGAAESLTGVISAAEGSAAEQALERRGVFQEELGAYEAALEELGEAAAGRTLFAAAHGFEYIAAAADLELEVMVLEIQEGGKPNDHAAEELELAAAKEGHGGVLLWRGQVDGPFAEIARDGLGLVSVPLDLGDSTWSAQGTSLLGRLTASTEALTRILRENQ